jgi:hypothetical protein
LTHGFDGDLASGAVRFQQETDHAHRAAIRHLAIIEHSPGNPGFCDLKVTRGTTLVAGTKTVAMPTWTCISASRRSINSVAPADQLELK